MYDFDDEILYGGNIGFKCISAVYLGYRIHPEIRKNIQEICDRISSETSPIAVYQAELSPTEYKIEYRRLKTPLQSELPGVGHSGVFLISLVFSMLSRLA